MPDTPKIVNIRPVPQSDLALLEAKSAQFKIVLFQKFSEICGVLDQMTEAGISVEFAFSKQPDGRWQVASKVYKEL